MIFYCISEPDYETSNWYKHIVNGLLNEKRSKRFTVILADSDDEISKFPITAEDVLFVIGSNSEWLDNIIDIFEKKFENRIIVLGNCNRSKGRRYSIVASDISRDVMLLFNYLKSNNKNKIAMYGINPDSASDKFRKRSFIEWSSTEEDVFLNNGNLEECFKNFKEKANEYEGIICANDYSAISLIRHMKANKMQLPFIVSCGETMLAREFSPCITNLKTNYTEFGKAGIQVAKMLLKNNGLNSVECYLSGEIVPGKTTEFLPMILESSVFSTFKTQYDESFYADVEVDEMLRIEKLLNISDKTDIQIIKFVMSGLTYSEIADKLYMSTNGIKYKLKSMYEICGANSKNEFVDLIKKYIGE